MDTEEDQKQVCGTGSPTRPANPSMPKSNGSSTRRGASGTGRTSCMRSNSTVAVSTSPRNPLSSRKCLKKKPPKRSILEIEAFNPNAVPGERQPIANCWQTTQVPMFREIAWFNSNRLWGEWDHTGNLRCARAVGQLQERQGAQYNTDLPYAAAQQARQFVLVFGYDPDTQGGRPTPRVCAKTFWIGIVSYAYFGWSLS